MNAKMYDHFLPFDKKIEVMREAILQIITKMYRGFISAWLGRRF